MASRSVEWVEGGRREHGNQRQYLEQMVLDHVAQCPGAVIEPGATFEPEGFVEHNVDGGDMLGGEQRLHHPVGEADPQDVQHGRHPKEVVDAVHVILRHQGHSPTEDRCDDSAALSLATVCGWISSTMWSSVADRPVVS